MVLLLAVGEEPSWRLPFYFLRSFVFYDWKVLIYISLCTGIAAACLSVLVQYENDQLQTGDVFIFTAVFGLLSALITVFFSTSITAANAISMGTMNAMAQIAQLSILIKPGAPTAFEIGRAHV